MKKVKLNKKEMTKYFNQLTEYTIKCKCGHSVQFTDKQDRIICTWCNKWIYKNSKVEFKYRMRGAKNEVKRG